MYKYDSHTTAQYIHTDISFSHSIAIHSRLPHLKSFVLVCSSLSSAT